jgi:hypothetical protein
MPCYVELSTLGHVDLSEIYNPAHPSSENTFGETGFYRNNCSNIRYVIKLALKQPKLIDISSS